MTKYYLQKLYQYSKIRNTNYMINETIIEGRKFRQLNNKKSETWERISGWIVTDMPFRKAVPINNSKTQKEK